MKVLPVSLPPVLSVVALLLVSGLLPGIASAFAASSGSPAKVPELSGSSLSGWTNVSSATSPSPRSSPALAFDAKDGYILLYGGSSPDYSELTDTWTFSSGAWTELSPPAGSAPGPAGSNSLAYDWADGYCVLFQGSTGETWTFQHGSWSELNITGPSARWGAAFAADDSTGSLLLFGGRSGASTMDEDTWEYSHGTWQNVTLTAGTPPSARWGASLSYDPSLPGGGGMILFGGANGTANFNDTWLFAGGAWTPAPKGAAPNPRYDAGLAWSAADSAPTLYGGTNGTAWWNDTWEYSGGSWVRESIPRAPSLRSTVGMVYDPYDGTTLLFGGTMSNVTFGDTWEWDGTGMNAGLSAAALVYPTLLDQGSAVSIFAHASGGSGVYTYHWTSLPTGCSATSTSFLNCTPSGTGASWVNLTVNDSLSHTTSAVPVRVDVYPSLSIVSFAVSPTLVSQGALISLTTVVQGGATPWSFTYIGLPSGCSGAVMASFSCRPTQPGNYTLYVKVTDLAGSVVSHSTSLEVTALPPPSVAIHANITTPVAGQSLALQAVVTGGSAPIGYGW
ncbi:MAG: hypothetical protein JRN35_09055, partial [Nitrososphaerota archaeon]|nr:hypothetical protein [Nitrososphaerota archaeon]